MTAQAAAKAYLDKAERALSEARLLLRDNATEGACSRAYYAMHDAAHAALIASGNENPDAMIKTHHGLIARFGETLVRSGQVDVALGRAFNGVQDMRLLADYASEPPPLEQAIWAVEQAERFVATMRSAILASDDTPDAS